MSDVADGYRAYKAARQREGQERRQFNARLWTSLVEPLSEIGVMLHRHDDGHYAVEHKRVRWLVNLYPGNQRIYADRNRPKAPYLSLPDPWTLQDVADELLRLADGGQEKTEADTIDGRITRAEGRAS
jgi:hypothetical protein